MRSMADSGEWQELVDLLIASLTLTQAPVTADERERTEVPGGSQGPANWADQAIQ